MSTKKICLELLRNGKSAKEIRKELNISEIKWKELGLTNLIKYTNIFESINEVSAYWLGFLWADGSLTDNVLELEINAIDKYHLEKLASLFSNIKTPTIYTRNRKNSTTCRIHFSDTQIAQSLRDLGFNNKGLRSIPNIKTEMMPHFIAGYFDGDGSYIERHRNGLIEFRADICGPEIVISYLENFLPKSTCQEIIHNKKWTSKRLYWNGKDSVVAVLNYLNISKTRLIRKNPQLLH